jgi:hypothetical protein
VVHQTLEPMDEPLLIVSCDANKEKTTMGVSLSLKSLQPLYARLFSRTTHLSSIRCGVVPFAIAALPLCTASSSYNLAWLDRVVNVCAGELTSSSALVIAQCLSWISCAAYSRMWYHRRRAGTQEGVRIEETHGLRDGLRRRVFGR